MKGITMDTLNNAIDLAVGGVVDYYGRACVLRWEDMEKVEAARARALHR